MAIRIPFERPNAILFPTRTHPKTCNAYFVFDNPMKSNTPPEPSAESDQWSAWLDKEWKKLMRSAPEGTELILIAANEATGNFAVRSTVCPHDSAALMELAESVNDEAIVKLGVNGCGDVGDPSMN